MSKKKTLENFIQEANLVHNNRYDYSKTEYHDNKTKVCIICPEHGEFWQKPDKHLQGQGCPICSGTLKSNSKTFIQKAKSIHHDKYDYSKVNYVNNKTKVCIICPKHGEFWQDPHNHLKGKGCPECGKEILKTGYDTTTFIKKAISVWGNSYDYSKTNYLSAKEKVCIICLEHGEFWQEAESHLQGCGCPICANIKNGIKKRSNTDEFIEKAKKIHHDKYDYTQVEYITAKHKVKIICPEHGEFWQSPYHHLNSYGCPKCVHPISNAEIEIYNFVCDIVGKENVIQGDRKLLNGKELDIYIPSLNFAIEYNGLYWHTIEIHHDKNYHLNKLKLCHDKGVKLIQIFEDEYINHKEVVLEKIRHIIGKCENYTRIMARKCEIKEISLNDARVFLDKNHVQGYGGGSVHLGVFYHDNLIAVMNFRQNGDEWELTRFASDINYVCQGIGGKLFQYFVRHYNPIMIKSFADRRWTVNEVNNVYLKLGFVFDSYVRPDYRYYKSSDGIIRQHKFGFRKSTLHKKYGLPLTMTENEMTKKLGYTKIYDCGLIKYIWKNPGV